MKEYIKPLVIFVELRSEETYASLGSLSFTSLGSLVTFSSDEENDVNNELFG